MKIPHLVFLIVICCIIIFFKVILPYLYNRWKENRNQTISKADISNLSTNDKIIALTGVKENELDQVISTFTNKYGLTDIFISKEIGESSFIITFIQDIDFQLFCFLINYLKYPESFNYNASIEAWCTTKKRESSSPKINGKRLMISLDPNDKEYDNVYAIPSDNNDTYKISFSDGIKLSKEFSLKYKNPPLIV